MYSTDKYSHTFKKCFFFLFSKPNFCHVQEGKSRQENIIMENQSLVVKQTVLSYSRMEDTELASWGLDLETLEPRMKSSQIINFDNCNPFCEFFIF